MSCGARRGRSAQRVVGGACEKPRDHGGAPSGALGGLGGFWLIEGAGGRLVGRFKLAQTDLAADPAHQHGSLLGSEADLNHPLFGAGYCVRRRRSRAIRPCLENRADLVDERAVRRLGQLSYEIASFQPCLEHLDVGGERRGEQKYGSGVGEYR